ncbi:MAG: hypothetical protein QW327_02430 [Candidatus Odinarchaeota archaeon]
MIYLVSAIILIILGAFFTLSLLSDLPAKGNLKLQKTLTLTILISILFGFGVHFLFLALGL